MRSDTGVSTFQASARPLPGKPSMWDYGQLPFAYVSPPPNAITAAHCMAPASRCPVPRLRIERVLIFGDHGFIAARCAGGTEGGFGH